MADMEEIDPGSRRTYRAALAAVIILSVLLVAAVIAVVAGFVRQARLYQAARSSPTIAAPAASIQLAPGAHILSSTTEGGRLVLHVQTPAGSEVDVMDLATGKLITRVKDGAP